VLNAAAFALAAALLSALRVPAQNRTHWAVEGRGAWLRAGDAPDERIRCKAFSESDEGLVIVGSASHNTPDTDAFVADYKARGAAAHAALLSRLRSHVMHL
jgi:3'-phosphoadenosine 5'-phosphosulfate (PAPS) 3'-phosphatase